ncbi:NERD domain-containing protein kinase family protein [Ferrimonas balearica]|uniref:NERD domain-containing protein kinase family protein n=1 Tax=Ferrimonas balearica TaxID=44012 RepID=UPI001C98F605|nr:NERD domain-containing protein kinase family protein [Ferrimonas balearica]MBY5920504.1 NERD domain-containing protein [Ferrimonas balearica]MBY5996811.1 NERD domain-containing protein [Ferrimonas balearica]
MAKQIRFGDPVNESERWAFKLLAEELPDEYLLLTNIEIPTQTGQALEVDALVIGQWGIYVVDVKGYIGQLEAGQHAWQLDGRDVDNSLAKANYVARVLAGRFKHKFPIGVYAPWCQGMVFVTGRRGNEISLRKREGELSIYTPEQIVEALTGDWALTSRFAHQVTEQQKELVLDAIGQVALVEQRNNRIQDFEKQKCLYIKHGLEIWQADYNPGDWQAPWLLKILVPSECEDQDQATMLEGQMREELYRLQQLAGCSGVPFSAPLIQDGEQLVLPIRMPRGTPMHQFDYQKCDRTQALSLLVRAAVALQQIHRRGITVSGWGENGIFLSESGEVEFIDIRNTLTEAEDIQHFATVFSELAHCTHEPRITSWFAEAARGRTDCLDELRVDLALVVQRPEASRLAVDPDTLAPGMAIDGRYQLETCIVEGESSQLWQARHLQGQYPCALSVYRGVSERWPHLASTYKALKGIYHPNVEQVLDFGEMGRKEALYITRAWVEGESLRDLQGRIVVGQPGAWFPQLLTALYYLHSQQIFHGAICPANIICQGNRAVLVNFGVGLDVAASGYARRYADPELWASEGAAEQDLFGLVASFVDVLAPGVECRDRAELLAALDDFSAELVPEAFRELCRKVLNFEFQLLDGVDYLSQFGWDEMPARPAGVVPPELLEA